MFDTLGKNSSVQISDGHQVSSGTTCKHDVIQMCLHQSAMYKKWLVWKTKFLEIPYATKHINPNKCIFYLFYRHIILTAAGQPCSILLMPNNQQQEYITVYFKNLIIGDLIFTFNFANLWSSQLHVYQPSPWRSAASYICNYCLFRR